MSSFIYRIVERGPQLTAGNFVVVYSDSYTRSDLEKHIGKFLADPTEVNNTWYSKVSVASWNDPSSRRANGCKLGIVQLHANPDILKYLPQKEATE